jgi:hypothetical protein
VPSSEESPELYVDRSLGQIVVPEALEALGFVVHTELSIFGELDEGVADVTWLERVGSEGWVALTKEARIRYRPAEAAVIAAFGVRLFAVASGNLGAAEQAARIVENIERIVEACRESGPFVYSVQAGRIVRLFPR